MRPFLPALLLCALPLAAQANDGWGGLSATGLTFGQTDAVAMVEEDLFIGLDRIEVDYLFRNTTDQDVRGEVIFPLPPVGLWSMLESSWNLPEDYTRENLVNFTATVDGQPVDLKIDRIAVLEEPWDETRPLSAQYDTPGRDVTADLARYGLPLTLDYEQVAQALLTLAPEARDQAVAEGLIAFYPGDPAQSYPDEIYPLWSILWRYHWTQTFPAGAEVRVHHAYENRPSGGLFYWSHPPEEYQQYVVDAYCVDEGTSKAIAKSLAQNGGSEQDSYGVSYNIEYVLRTANSWAGPIGTFRLTLDKGDPKNILSLCAEGVKKVGPTSFVIEKTDFSPSEDLSIMVVAPGANFHD